MYAIFAISGVRVVTDGAGSRARFIAQVGRGIWAPGHNKSIAGQDGQQVDDAEKLRMYNPAALRILTVTDIPRRIVA